MTRELLKGNEAIAEAAVRAGLEAYFGYPITPQTELLEYMARRLPPLGRVFLQAESEVAAINMVYGAACTGARVMTSSSSPGVSLMMEGMSYIASSEVPCVIVDVMRGGPGLGNIAPEQSDYHQIVKGGGHGNYHTIVLAPNSCQEMCDLTFMAFELADQFRNPAVVLADGFIGQMMEPVEFPEVAATLRPKPWALRGDAETRQNLISSIYISSEELERHVLHLEEKYGRADPGAEMYELYRTEDAEVVVIGYGIVSRLLRAAVDQARERGIRAGLFRPVTLWPFPGRELSVLSEWAELFLTVELSNGQLVEDVRLAVDGRRPVRFYSRVGGMVPTTEELLAQIVKASEEKDVRESFSKTQEFLWAV